MAKNEAYSAQGIVNVVDNAKENTSEAQITEQDLLKAIEQVKPDITNKTYTAFLDDMPEGLRNFETSPKSAVVPAATTPPIVNFFLVEISLISVFVLAGGIVFLFVNFTCAVLTEYSELETGSIIIFPHLYCFYNKFLKFHLCHLKSYTINGKK